ncbi:LemA family protein [Oceanithermus sp.]
MTALWIFLIVLAIAGGFIALTYNALIARKNQIDYAQGAVDALLKKRYDLIPNLVATVKGYAKHERELLEKVTELRSRIGQAKDDDERLGLEGQMSGLLGRLLVQLEAYPDLKANQNFLQLQAALNEIEEQISAARRAFNAAVVEFNNAIEMFPSNLVAGWMGLKRRKVFEVEKSESAAPNVADLFGNA